MNELRPAPRAKPVANREGKNDMFFEPKRQITTEECLKIQRNAIERLRELHDIEETMRTLPQNNDVLY